MTRATVLLADDPAIVAGGLAGLLREEFTLLGTATDGPALLEAARRERPDVIVSDIAMPGMTGLEVLRKLRAEALPCRVIFLTMHADAPLAAAALRAGASGFKHKHAPGEERLTPMPAALAGRP